MAALENTTMTADIKLEAREIAFITMFQRNWQSLQEILGIMRPIRKEPGTKLVSSKATVELQDGNVPEGDEVPLSKATVVPVAYEDIDLEKFRKAVTAEAVNKFGAAIAVRKTDEAFLMELQNKVLDRFYAFAQTGTLTGHYDTLQMAVSMSITMVKDKFKKLRLNYGNIVTFVNTVDVGKYLGAAEITLQTRNGIEYMKDFLGASTVIVSSEIPEGTVISTPVDNIVLYYVSPADADFAELGLNYTITGETNLIGVHAEGNYTRVMGEMHALMGMKLFAEYIDAIAVYTFGENDTLGTLTVTSAAGTITGDTAITVTPAKASGNSYKYKVADNATSVTYNQNVQTWTAWDGTSDIEATSGKTITVVECDAGYKAKKAGTATVVAKS